MEVRKVQERKGSKESYKVSVESSKLETLKRNLRRLKGALTGTLWLAAALHVAKIVVGSVYLRSCPAQPKIPVYLITAGIVGLASKLLALLRDYARRYEKPHVVLWFYIALGLLGTLEFVLFICGSIWVYGVYEPIYDPYYHGYCDKTVYVFAFVIITAFYAAILFVVAVGGCAILTCCVAMAVKLRDVETDEAEEKKDEKM